MTAAAIVQARTGSSRLPGKVLMRLAGETVLSHVLRRCQRVAGIDRVCCATTGLAADDAVAEEARRVGAEVFRGAEDDVLARYAGAAAILGADVVLRVTADCPLIDPEICAAVLELREAEGADFACNNMPPSWPHGLDCEAFTHRLLKRAAQSASAAAEREHVTPWMRSAADVVKVNLPAPGVSLTAHRWTLDYPEDWAFFDALFAIEPAIGSLGWRAIAATIAAHPEIAELNMRRHDPARGASGNAAAPLDTGRPTAAWRP